MVQLPAELGQRQHRNQWSGQFNGEGEAVQAPAHLHDLAPVGVREGEAGAHRRGPVSEKEDRLLLEREWRQREHSLAGDAQRGATVASTDNSGQRCASSSTSKAQASRTPSQLSSTRSARPSVNRSCRPSTADLPGCSGTPSLVATVPGTRSPAASEANSTSQTPSGKRWRRRLAASSASLVFPAPPGPASVTTRWSSSTRSTVSSSQSRPTNVVRGNGNRSTTATVSRRQAGGVISARHLRSGRPHPPANYVPSIRSSTDAAARPGPPACPHAAGTRPADRHREARCDEQPDCSGCPGCFVPRTGLWSNGSAA